MRALLFLLAMLMGSPASAQLPASPSYAPVVKATAPAVVNVYTEKTVRSSGSPFENDPFFGRFFGRGFGFGVPRERVMRSLGSGVIVGEDGLIITNHHVAGNADQIKVVLADRREYPARVLLADERTDLAVLKIDTGGEKLPVIPFGDSDELEVGDIVLAIGNPFGVGQTVTSGIVSALARTGVGITDYQFFIQTDAAINPGNSGGALIDAAGRLIGINTAIYSRDGGSNGIGFAIPANMVAVVLEAARNDGKIVRPYLGLSGQSVSPDIAASIGLARPQGVLIDQVTPGSAAADAGIASGDVILAIDGRPVDDVEGLRYRIATKKIGSVVTLDRVHQGAKDQVAMTLIAPPEVPARDLVVLDGENSLSGLEIGNLSPAFAMELGIDPVQSGVVVVDAAEGSYAWRLRLFQRGDILRELNGVAITDTGALKALVDQSQPRDISYQLVRNGQTMFCGFRPPGSLSCRR